MIWGLLILAAFCAGVLNAMAGGGTFLTFPALVHSGIGPIPANATSTVAVLPGYLTSALGYREEIRRISRRQLGFMLVASLSGGLLGSLLLLVTPARIFSAIIPWLLLFATLLFLAGDRITAALHEKGGRGAGILQPGLFLVSLYGGYFNGGLGIMLMALFAVAGFSDLNQANGLKNLLSFALSLISVATFLVAGLVEPLPAAVMAAAAMAGGYAGARAARLMPRPLLRRLIVAVGFSMSALFFFRL